jgi:hypothetical protein
MIQNGAVVNIYLDAIIDADHFRYGKTTHRAGTHE